jgi:hypothetical protein
MARGKGAGVLILELEKECVAEEGRVAEATRTATKRFHEEQTAAAAVTAWNELPLSKRVEFHHQAAKSEGTKIIKDRLLAWDGTTSPDEAATELHRKLFRAKGAVANG